MFWGKHYNFGIPEGAFVLKVLLPFVFIRVIAQTSLLVKHKRRANMTLQDCRLKKDFEIWYLT